MRARWLVVLVLLVPGAAWGTVARVESLQRDPLQADETDVFRFPGVLPAYSDSLWFEFSPSPLDGWAGGAFGRPWSFGVAGHRPIEWDDVAEMIDLFDWSAQVPVAEPILDLLVGYGTGGHGFGLRFGVAAGFASSENAAAATGEDASTALGFDLTLGYSTDIPGYRGDSGLSLAFKQIEVKEDGLTAAKSIPVPSFLLEHRSLVGPESGVRFGFDILFTRREYGATDAAGADTNMARWLVRVTVGPHAGLGANVVLSGGIAFGYEWEGGSVAGVEQGSLAGVMLPGLVLSLEAEVVSWLVVRAGGAYDLVLEHRTARAGGLTTLETQSLRHGFSWSVGVGFRWDRVRLDAMVAPDLFFQGPALVGGGTPGLFAQVSAAVEF